MQHKILESYLISGKVLIRSGLNFRTSINFNQTNINFFYVHDPDVKITHVGQDGTAQNFRPVSNTRESMDYFDPEVQEV